MAVPRLLETKCPNCDQSFEVVINEDHVAECPYCHESIDIPASALKPVDFLYLRFRQLSDRVDIRCLDCVLEGGFFPNVSIWTEPVGDSPKNLIIECHRCKRRIEVDLKQFLNLLPGDALQKYVAGEL